MRIAFISALTELAKKDKNIMLLTGDLGFSVFENFAQKFPKQYLNCGVAEQNMVGMAAGLALSGKKVFVYSIIPFATMRPFEQIRNDVCLHNLDVKIIGVGGGYSYGQLGSTHHAIEDLAIMRSLPNMTVVCPADPIETTLAVQAITKLKRPAYLRLGKSKEENIHKKSFSFKIGKANLIKNGSDITIIGIGPVLKNAILAAESLEKKHRLSVRIISMSTLKPLDKDIVLRVANEAKAIFTVEEHSIIGGLGEAVASVLAELPKIKFKAVFKKIGVDDSFAKVVGDQNYLREKAGLSAQAIEKLITKTLKFKN